MPVVTVKNPLYSVDFWKFTSSKGARWVFDFSPPYVAYDLGDGTWGIMSKTDRRGNVLIKPKGGHYYTAFTNKAIAQQIAKQWNSNGKNRRP